MKGKIKKIKKEIEYKWKQKDFELTYSNLGIYTTVILMLVFTIGTLVFAYKVVTDYTYLYLGALITFGFMTFSFVSLHYDKYMRGRKK